MKFLDKHGWEHTFLIQARIANLLYKFNEKTKKKNPEFDLDDSEIYREMHKYDKKEDAVDAKFREIDDDDDFDSDFFDTEDYDNEISDDLDEEEIPEANTTEVVEETEVPNTDEVLADKTVGDIIENSCIEFRYNREWNTIEIYNYQKGEVIDKIPVTEDIKLGLMNDKLKEWKAKLDSQTALDSLLSTMKEITG